MPNTTVDLPPLHHLSDWSAWTWVVSGVGAMVLIAVALAAIAAVVDDNLLGAWGSTASRTGTAVVVAIVSTIGALTVDGHVIRHIATPTASRLWMLLPLAFAAGIAVVATLAHDEPRRWFGWGLAGVTAVGGVGIATSDALNRTAANIPMGVKSLVGLIIFGIIAAAVYAVSQSQSSHRS